MLLGENIFILKGSLGDRMKFIFFKILCLCFATSILFSCQPQVVKEEVSSKFEFSKSKITFYIASKNGKSASQRVYNKSFNQDLTDYVWYELYLERDLTYNNFRPIEIIEKWSKILDDKKVLLSQKKRQLYLLKNGYNFEFTAGFKPDLGYDKGLYLLEVFYNNHILIEKNFKIK